MTTRFTFASDTIVYSTGPKASSVRLQMNLVRPRSRHQCRLARNGVKENRHVPHKDEATY